MATYFLPPALKKLRAKAPGIQIEIIASNEMSDLRQREADLAKIQFVGFDDPERRIGKLEQTYEFAWFLTCWQRVCLVIEEGPRVIPLRTSELSCNNSQSATLPVTPNPQFPRQSLRAPPRLPSHIRRSPATLRGLVHHTGPLSAKRRHQSQSPGHFRNRAMAANW